MAKPYQEGAGWSVRLRVKGQDIYLSGYKTESAASKAAEKTRQAILNNGKPVGRGPWSTTVAEAMQQYARERVPYLKGARQVADRFNRYLRTQGLDLIRLTPPATTNSDTPVHNVYCGLELVPCPAKRRIPRGLKQHRDDQKRRRQKTDEHRTRLARTMMADVSCYQLQSLVDAMRDEGYQASTINLERSELRNLFNHARHVWSWPEPTSNPARRLKMLKIDNERKRVLTNAEWKRLSTALAEYGNAHVLPALILLLQTTMRSSEPLLRATWAGVDWERCVLTLPDAKAGPREVPLNPDAMAVLHQLLERRAPDSSDARILPLTYEALKKAWNVACEKTDLDDANIHDLRRTGATRYALVYNGNMPVVKIITGHKTDSQVLRYIKISTDIVVGMLHGRQLDEDKAPAGMTAAEVAGMVRSPSTTTSPPLKPTPLPANVIAVDFGRRAA